MKKSIFNQPLNLDVLKEISKGFPKSANVQNIEFDRDTQLRHSISCGYFDASLTHKDILSFMKTHVPVIPLLGHQKVLVPDGMHSEEYYVVVVRDNENYNNKLSICDTSDFDQVKPVIDSENTGLNFISVYPLRKPRFVISVSNPSTSIVLLIPYNKSSRKDKINLLIARAKDGGFFVDFDRLSYAIRREIKKVAE